VLPNSPAAAGGLQKNDVLKQFNDQQLVDPSQLATLVHAAGKDADVTLTIVRKGQEQKVAVKLGERMMPERRPLPLPGMKFPFHDAEVSTRDLRDRVEEMRKTPFGALPEFPVPNRLDPAPGHRAMPPDVLREVQPGGAQRVITDGGRTTWNTAPPSGMNPVKWNCFPKMGTAP
jgi:hypothetical protein